MPKPEQSASRPAYAARLRGIHAMVAVEITGRPGDHRALDERIGRQSEVDPDGGAGREQRAHDLPERQACGLVATAARGRLLHHQRIDNRQHQPAGADQDEGHLPAQVLGEAAADDYAE